MSNPLSLVFKADTSSAIAGVQNLAAAVASNMVKIVTAVDRVQSGLSASAARESAAFDLVLEKGKKFGDLAKDLGGYGQAAKSVASTVAGDMGKIGSAVGKAANDHNYAVGAMGLAALNAARQTETGTAAMSAAWAVGTSPVRARVSLLKNEIAGVWNTIAANPVVMGGAAAVTGILAIGFALSAVEKAAKAAEERLAGIIKIATDAAGAGVGTTFFQGWALQAKELNTEADKLIGMLNRAREAATVRIGEGDKDATSAIGDRLKQNVLAGNLGQGDLDRYTGAKSQEDRIRVVLDLIEQLRAKGSQLAAFDLAGKMFGSDFEEKLRNGVDMVGKMRAALDGLKTAGGERVISPEEVASAQRLKDTIEATHKILADAMAPIQKDIAAWQTQQAQAAAEFNKSLAEAAAWALKLYEPIQRVGQILTDLGNAAIWDKIYGAAKALGLTNNAVQDLTEADRTPKTDDATPLPAITVPGDTSKPLPSLTPAKEGTAEKEDPLATYIKSLERSTAALKAEVDAYGKSNAEKQRAIVLARAEEIAKQRGADLTEEETKRLIEVATAAGVAKDKMAALEQQSQQAADAMRSFGELGTQAFEDLILNGKSFDQTIQGIVKQLAKWAIQATLMGTGPMAGLFGTAAAPGQTGAASVGGLFGTLFGGSKLSGGGVGSGASTTTALLGGGSAGTGGATGADLVSRATSMIGLSETKDRTQLNGFLTGNGVKLDVAQDAWCAAFVNANLKSMGVAGSGSQLANSFQTWGSKVGDLSKVLPGDVLVESRGGGPGSKGGHVGIATGLTRTAEDGGLQLQMISGNSGNRVARTWEDADGLIGRRGLADAATQAEKSVTDLSGSVGKLAETASAGSGPLDGIGKALEGALGSAAGGAAGAGGGGGDFLGGIVGWLGKAFGGAFAEGGDLDAGKWALVGEKGPELIGPAGGARSVIPNGALRGLVAPSVKAGSFSSTSTNVTYAPAHTMTAGNGGPTIEDFAAMLRADRAAFSREVPGIVAAAQMRAAI